MNQRLKQCPTCNSSLEIIEYHCPKCDTTIKGRFSIGDLASLSISQQEFVKVFVCNGGNIKEVEKALGISYPTVKNRLSEVSGVLCPQLRPGFEDFSTEILEEIEKGDISVDEAIEKLKKRS
jgi:hypothetical protein